MRVLIIDGHPAEGRLTTHLLDHYAASLGAQTRIVRFAVRDLEFDRNLRSGYQAPQPWEPDLEHLATELIACDHLVVGYPLWWGSEPALLTGLLDRLLLPGFAFQYRRDSPFWDRLLVGRSADVIITMDTPPWYLALVYGNPVVRRWRRQILGFCGLKPIRFYALGPTRRGEAANKLQVWRNRLQRAAASAHRLQRGHKADPIPDRSQSAPALKDGRE